MKKHPPIYGLDQLASDTLYLKVRVRVYPLILAEACDFRGGIVHSPKNIDQEEQARQKCHDQELNTVT
jgi:hypothetical protein